LVETVKPAESGRAIVLRLYEAHGRRGIATLNVPQNVTKVQICDLLETVQEVVPVKSGGYNSRFAPMRSRR